MKPGQVDQELVDAFERGEGLAELTLRGINPRLVESSVERARALASRPSQLKMDWERANKRERVNAPREGDLLWHAVLALAFENSRSPVEDMRRRLGGVSYRQARRYRDAARERIIGDPSLRTRLEPLAQRVRDQTGVA